MSGRVDSIADVLKTFFAECHGLLEQMEDGLLRLRSAPADFDAINEVFRAAHTIKGSAGLFALDHVVTFTHHVEGVLDRARDGRLALDMEGVGLLLNCRDHVERLLDAAVAEATPNADVLEENQHLVRCLSALLEEDEPSPPNKVGAAPGEDASTVSDDDAWHISVRFGTDLFRKGMSPTPLLRCLARMGELVHVITVADALPVTPDMDPESCYLGLEIRLRSAASKASIEDVFEFVRDDCLLQILPPGSRVTDYMRLIDELPEDDARIGEMLLACGAITQHELEEILAIQADQRRSAGITQPIGELVVQQHAAPAEVVRAALLKQRETRLRHNDAARLIRVQSGKLDGLIDRVGALVIASAGIGQMAAQSGENGLLEAVAGMARLVEDIRDDAMRLRMVEIGETFSRFRRVVRDLSAQLGKDIELEIEGADTELDKNLVENIADPLTHLVRNAIDHGIESAERREAAGKPVRGVIRLAARHEAGSVIIEVSDDGGGLDREGILAKARQRGMLADGAQPADADVWKLIFLPGFSTAKQVSNLSGRGVGMDVVKESIEAMRGNIEIDSVRGQGTTFRVRLPLTLAIIDGFLMGVAGSHYVTPLDTVIECVELEAQDDGRGYLNLRGEVLPLLRLREHFGLESGLGRRQSVVVVANLGFKLGLVVDQLEGELQAVIKPLGRLFSRLVGISGTTILGSGEIALVLDIPSLLASITHGGRDAIPPKPMQPNQAL